MTKAPTPDDPLKDVRAECGGSGSTESVPPLQRLDISAWGNRPAPEPLYHIKGFMAAAESGCLAGRSNAGKGLLVTQQGIAVATGRGLFGLEGSGKPQGVIFVEMEDSPEELERRIARYLDFLRQVGEWSAEDETNFRKNFIILVPNWKSDQPKTLTGVLPLIKEACKDREVGLIILDTLAALSDGDENSVEAQRSIWPACYDLRDLTGACVLLVHHTRKAYSSGKTPGIVDRLNFDTVRGSSAIVAGARFIQQVEPLTNGEAKKLNLDEDKALRGGYLLFGMTKVVSGPKGGMILLEQLEGLGGGFWTPHPQSASLIAQLQSNTAVEKLSKAEAVLLSIASGITTRKALAAKHWTEYTEPKGLDALKGILNHLRNRHGWLEAGSSMNLTPAGHQHVQELQHRQRENNADDA